MSLKVLKFHFNKYVFKLNLLEEKKPYKHSFSCEELIVMDW